MTYFKDLLELGDKSGVYALINQEDKKIWIGQAKNIVTALSRNVTLLRSNNHICSKDAHKLDFKVLDIVTDPRALPVRLRFWTDEYIALGYTPYRSIKCASYALKLSPGTDFRPTHRMNLLYYVKLVNRRYKGFIVGVFNTEGEANNFVKTNYSNTSVVNDVIMSKNRLTELYVQSRACKFVD